MVNKTITSTASPPPEGFAVPDDDTDYAENIAEINGFLCGFICTGTASDAKNWLDCLLGYLKIAGHDLLIDRLHLIEMYKSITQQIQQETFGFSLAFPRTQLPLHQRTLALKRWCCGFIAGFQHSDISSEDHSLIESLQRFDNVAHLDLNKIEIRAEDETMFLQVSTLLEAAMMQIYRHQHLYTKVKH